MNDNIKIKGNITWEVLENGEWVHGGENHNVTNIQYKQGLANSLAGGTQIIANKMTAGDVNTSFTDTSIALGNTVGVTTSLTNTVPGTITICVGTILFSGSYTIQEVGLWFNNIPIAFGNVSQAVTSTKPIRITWTITNL